MKKSILAIFFIISFVIFCENDDTRLFKDITRDHWAYKYVENLVYKGIIPRDSSNFNGEENVSRYEMAEYLSKVLNKLDDEKASQEDLRILEKLVYEFSKELNSYGLNIEQYISKIKTIEEDKNKLLKKQEENDKRISELEKELTVIKSQGVKINGSDNQNEIKNFGESLKNIDIELESYLYTKELNSKEKKFDTFYKISTGIKKNNGEIKFLYDTNEKKGYTEFMYKQEFIKGVNVTINSPGYKKELSSFYENINFNSCYNSWNLSGEHALGEILLEKNHFSRNFEYIDDSLTVLGKIKFDYADILTKYNFEEKSFDYEAAAIFPFLQKFNINGGYGKTGNFRFLNAQGEYKNREVVKLKLGYERKDMLRENEQLYNNLFAKFNYRIFENLESALRIDYLDTFPGGFVNYGVLLKNKIGSFDLYLSFAKKKIEKEGIESVEYIAETKDKGEDISEVKVKANYNLSDNFRFNAGYCKKDSKISKNDVMFLGFDMEYDKNLKLFMKYLKSGNIYYDNDKDMDGNYVDIDFDEKSFILGENNEGYKRGILKIGFDLKF